MTDSHPQEAGASPALSETTAGKPPQAEFRHGDPRTPEAEIPPDAELLPPEREYRSPFTPPPPGSLVAPFLENSFTQTHRGRHDGWTPERKRLFLDELSQGGVVTRAAQGAGMSAPAAYELRNRDPLFAAGWQAALHLARQRLADELLARSLNGVVEQIHRDGCIVGERHRYDNRLSLGLLNRLDRQAELADARDAAHSRVAGHWAAYLEALGAGRDAELLALVDPTAAAAAEAARSAPEDKDHKLRLQRAVERLIQSDRHEGVWQDEADDALSWTDYPAPDGFDGEEQGVYGEDGYRRTLTDDEARAYADAVRANEEEDRAKGETLRTAYFFGMVSVDEEEAAAA